MLPLLLAAKCNQDAPQYKMEAPLWKADSGTQSIVRKSQGSIKQILCSDKAFDNFTCTTDAAIQKEINKVIALSYQCEKWRDNQAPATIELFGQEARLDAQEAHEVSGVAEKPIQIEAGDPGQSDPAPHTGEGGEAD